MHETFHIVFHNHPKYYVPDLVVCELSRFNNLFHMDSVL